MRFGRGRLGRGRSFTASEPDALQTVLASLAADTWSENVATNTQRSVLERQRSDGDYASYYAASGQGAIDAPTSDYPFVYSSGDYAPELKVYGFTGGGHFNCACSEVSYFDMTTLTWSRKDESAKLAEFEAGDVPFESATNPGGAYESWYAHRNPSGRFAPISTHMYGGMAWMPHNSKFYVEGGAPYPTGVGSPGGSTWIDGATGHWDEDGAWANAPVGGKTNFFRLYVPECKVVNNYTDFDPTGDTFHGIFSVWENREGTLGNVDDKSTASSIRYFSALGAAHSHGTLIPDPLDDRFLAYVAHGDAQSRAAIMHRINAYRGTTGHSSDTAAQNYASSAPTNVGSGRWIYMGDHVPGCTKIACFNIATGLYALDISDWSWSSQIIASPIETTGEGIWKRFFYMPAPYDCFGLWDELGSALYVLKRPSVFS
jgi:hypothetical protein